MDGPTGPTGSSGNPRGRPPLDRTDPCVPVHFRLPGRQFDALDARARAERRSMADVIRDAIRRYQK